MNITNVQLISIDKICPDLEQPRQNFNKIEMSRLRESVLKQGILTPLLFLLLGIINLICLLLDSILKDSNYTQGYFCVVAKKK